MLAAEDLIQGDEVAETLAHLLTIDGDQVIVQPVANHRMTHRGDRLGNLTLVVRKDQIQSTTVDVKLIPQILASHRGALAVPAGEADAPGTLPLHDVLRGGFFPESKVEGVALLILAGELSRIRPHILDVTTGEATIIILLVVLLDVEVDRSTRDIGKAIV